MMNVLFAVILLYVPLFEVNNIYDDEVVKIEPVGKLCTIYLFFSRGIQSPLIWLRIIITAPGTILTDY